MNLLLDSLRSVHHDGSPRYVRAHSLPLALGEEVTLRLRAGSDAPVQHVLLYTSPDGEGRADEMQPQPVVAGPARWWQITLRLAQPVTHYRFLLLTSEGAVWFNGSGLHRAAVTDTEDFRLLANFRPPSWVSSSVFYQIFPDRFADGDPSNNVREGEYTYRGEPAHARRWNELPSQKHPAAAVEFFGGDLAGIRQRLGYLQELGVNALYLTPIFSALSNHRYDVTDYFNVDPHLGGNQALVDLRQAASELEMRLMLDLVPNHCGVMHPWFQQALQDAAAPTAEFFTFQRYPDEYACWLGVKSLPKLNYRSQHLRDVMYAGRDSVFRYWLRPPFSMDGWRIDVANMLARQGETQLGLEVGRGIRDAVKAENPEAYLLGENFFDGTHQLQGDYLDATMNYAGFADPLWHWLSGKQIRLHGQKTHLSLPAISAAEMAASWAAFRAPVPWVLARQQFNLLDSHDTQRIGARLNSGDPALTAARVRLAAALQMTYPGVPCVYYGDEIGMAGEDSLLTRAPMQWERDGWDPDLLAFYQELIHLRRTAPALIDGGFQLLAAEDDLIVYLRDAEDDQMLVVGQRGPGTRPAGPLAVSHGGIADGTDWVEVFSGVQARIQDGSLPLPQLPPGVMLWHSVRE